MTPVREGAALCAVPANLGYNQFRRVSSSQIGDQNFAGSCSCLILIPVAQVIRDCSILAAPQDISMSFKYCSMVLTLQEQYVPEETQILSLHNFHCKSLCNPA